MANINSNSANSAWKDATLTTFNYLVTETKSNAGKDAFIGDRIEDTIGNCWIYITGGGREQVQNYQVPTPSYQWIMDAVLQGKWEKWESAMDFASTLMNNMPANKNPDNQGQRPVSNHCIFRGIQPNVQVFEVTTHPQIFSEIVKIDERRNKLWWKVVINFRVVYNRNK